MLKSVISLVRKFYVASRGYQIEYFRCQELFLANGNFQEKKTKNLKRIPCFHFHRISTPTNFYYHVLRYNALFVAQNKCGIIQSALLNGVHSSPPFVCGKNCTVPFDRKFSFGFSRQKALHVFLNTIRYVSDPTQNSRVYFVTKFVDKRSLSCESKNFSRTIEIHHSNSAYFSSDFLADHETRNLK